MTKRTRTAAETARAPADRDEANTFLAEIGRLQREVAAEQGRLNASIADAKTAAEAAVKPLQARIEDLSRGLQLWAEANRALLTADGRTKTVKLPAGDVSWRHRPPRVTIRDAEKVLGLLIGNLRRFVRSKEEIDKEAILREPEAVASVSGITVGSVGEDFVIEPVEMPLAPTTKAAPRAVAA